jgi:Zinc carboxypeptidase
VLLIGGTHACELINPDLLLGLAWKLCFAYANDLGLVFGAPKNLPGRGPSVSSLAPPFPGKRYSASEIRQLVEGLDVFVAPNINPDGRTYVLSNYYDGKWDWRKNLSRNSDGSLGTDLNRNYDFVWEEAIGKTSPTPSDPNYNGAFSFSEPETRNVRWLLRTYPHIICLADVHSYGEVILHPWSDADNQSSDPSMSFRNPDWNDRREEAGYREYIPAADEAKFIDRGEKVRDAIAAVRGHTYTVGQSIDPPLKYTSSGTTKDYAYSRFFVDTARTEDCESLKEQLAEEAETVRELQRQLESAESPSEIRQINREISMTRRFMSQLRARIRVACGPATKVWAYTIETNRSNGDMQDGFSPLYADALEVMEEVQSGLIQFMLSCLCVVREIGKTLLAPELLEDLTYFRDTEMLERRRGGRWADLLDRHSDELLGLLSADPRAWQAAEQILVGAAQVVHARDSERPPVLGNALVTRIDRLATRLERRASPQLRKALTTIRRDAKSATGKNARGAIG